MEMFLHIWFESPEEDFKKALQRAALRGIIHNVTVLTKRTQTFDTGNSIEFVTSAVILYEPSKDFDSESHG